MPSPALQFPDAVVDVRRVRIALLVYGLFLLVVELVGSRLALIGWGQVTVLDVASAVADASLVVAVVLAVLLSGKLAVRRWQRWLRRGARARLVESLRPARPIDVRSWRETAPEAPARDEVAVTRSYPLPAFLSGYRYVTGPS
jgi:hypothetical protein